MHVLSSELLDSTGSVGERNLHGTFHDGRSETQFELGLSGTIELLVNGRIVGIEADEVSSTIGVPFIDDLHIRRDAKEVMKLAIVERVEVSSKIHCHPAEGGRGQKRK